MLFDTIAAIATPRGAGGIGIVRVSGPEALRVLRQLFRNRAGGVVGTGPDEWDSHRARYGCVVDPDTGDELDDVLALVMRGPHSYTGEDVVELSCHGGPLVLQRVLETVYRLGARPAERGEFTKRAFLNGRLDLAQAEAVIDLISATTDDSRRVALTQLRGRLSDEARAFRTNLLGIIARIEAVVDFPEEDIEALDDQALRDGLRELIGEAEQLASTARTGRILREGLATAIVGRPNVGKSSLLNALLREERAIVTSVPGTTRDVIEEQLDVGGVPIVLSDTAGLREVDDEVEQLGVERSRRIAGGAELVLMVLDDSEGLTEEDRRLYCELVEPAADRILVINKVDLDICAVHDRELLELTGEGRAPVVRVSALTGEGIEDLEALLRGTVYHNGTPEQQGALVTRARHRDAIMKAIESMQLALNGLESGVPADLVTVDLREAWVALGEITGETVGDDVLDRIFSEFCIGK